MPRDLRFREYKTKDFWERDFGFIARSSSKPFRLDVCVPSAGSIAFNLLLPMEEPGSLRCALYFNLDQGRFQMGNYKDNPSQADVEGRLARGLYFLGYPIERLAPFGVSRHDGMEWLRPPHEAWLLHEELRPDGMGGLGVRAS